MSMYKPDFYSVCRFGLTAFSKIFDFVKNVWFPITQQYVGASFCTTIKYDYIEKFCLKAKCFNKIKKGNIN